MQNLQWTMSIIAAVKVTAYVVLFIVDFPRKVTVAVMTAAQKTIEGGRVAHGWYHRFGLAAPLCGVASGWIAMKLTAMYVRSWKVKDRRVFMPPVRTDQGARWSRWLRMHGQDLAAEHATLPQLRWMEQMRQNNIATAMTAPLQKPIYALRYSMFIGMPRVLSVHPKDIEYILTSAQGMKNYRKGFEYTMLKAVLGPHSLVVINQDQLHTAHRRALNPAFRPSVLKEIAAGPVAEHTKVMLDTLQAAIVAPQGGSSPDQTTSASTPIQMSPIYDTTALGIVAAAAFRTLNISGTNVAEEFKKLIASFYRRSALSMAGFMGLKTKDILESDLIIAQCRRRLDTAADGIIAVARNKQLDEQEEINLQQQFVLPTRPETSSSPTMSTTLIDQLVSAPLFHGPGTESDIRDHIITFLFAGHETSSRALEWITYFLAKNPSVQEKLFEEVHGRLGLGQIPGSLEAIGETNEGAVGTSSSASAASVSGGEGVEPHLATGSLTYLRAVIYESLRLRPPAPMVIRTAQEDDVLPFSEAVVLKGEPVFINISVLHQNKDLYGEDAEAFRPERWEERYDPIDWEHLFRAPAASTISSTTTTSSTALHASGDSSKRVSLLDRVGPGGFLPFLIGPRNCIGMHFALQELFIVVAVLVRNFEIKWPEGAQEPELSLRVTLRSKNALKFELLPRAQ